MQKKKMKLPQPHRFGSCTRWKLSELEKAVAEQEGKEFVPTISPAEDCYLSAKQVANRYRVGVSTVWRWSRPNNSIAA